MTADERAALLRLAAKWEHTAEVIESVGRTSICATATRWNRACADELRALLAEMGDDDA